MNNLFLHKPIFLNRDLIAWTQLLLCFVIIDIALFSSSKFLLIVEMFVAGIMFTFWFLDAFVHNLFGILEEQKDTILRLLKLSQRAISKLEKIKKKC
jgi:hypothetical protein